MEKYKILVIAPSWVGDMVMSQTLFKALKKCYADKLQLDIVANSWASGILGRMPEVDNIIDNPFGHGELAVFKRLALAVKLRKIRYNQVFILPNSLKSAIIPFFAGIPLRTGFVGEMRYGLINNAYKLNKIRLPRMIDRFCALANSGNLPQIIDNPSLSIDARNQEFLAEKFNIDRNKPVIAFCPAAEYGPAKRWPPEYFAQLAGLLKEDIQVLILGSKNDNLIAKDILQKFVGTAKIINLCGETSLTDTADILALSNCVITNDSGLMHIACAVGAEVIAIYGSSSPDFTPPLSSNADITKIILDCAPCFQRTCRFGHYNCLRLVTPGIVLYKVQSILNKIK